MPFEEIYKENYKIVYGFLFSLCKNDSIAEELTADTFFLAFENISAFDGRSKVSTWLCQIAKNEYYKYQKKHSRQKSIDEFRDMPSDSAIEEAVQDKDTAMRLYRLLHELEEPYKEVFILRVFAQLSFKDIGVITQKTETWARVTYYRAKIKLLSQIERKE